MESLGYNSYEKKMGLTIAEWWNLVIHLLVDSLLYYFLRLWKSLQSPLNIQENGHVQQQMEKASEQNRPGRRKFQ